MQYNFEAIGTHWVIDIFDDSLLTDISQRKLRADIDKRIEEFDQVYSRFKEDSLVSKISLNENHQGGTYLFPDDARELFDFYKKLYQLTKGRVTPLIGKTLEQAGYDAFYSLQAKELTQPLPWEKVIQLNYPEIIFLQPALLDVGAAGKGYLVDLVVEVIENYKLEYFCVDAGGDMVYKNPDGKFLEVALENPMGTSQAIGVAKILNQSLCSSSGNRRKWEGYNHIINPDTLKSPDHIAGTWVVAKTGLISDGLATGLFFCEPEIFADDFSFEYLIMYTDGSINKSVNFPAELFYK